MSENTLPKSCCSCKEEVAFKLFKSLVKIETYPTYTKEIAEFNLKVFIAAKKAVESGEIGDLPLMPSDKENHR